MALVAAKLSHMVRWPFRLSVREIEPKGLACNMIPGTFVIAFKTTIYDVRVPASVKQTERTLAGNASQPKNSGASRSQIDTTTDSSGQLRARGGCDRCDLRHFLRDGGCINRPQQGIVTKRSGRSHRPQFRPHNCVVEWMALEWFLGACEGLCS